MESRKLVQFRQPRRRLPKPPPGLLLPSRQMVRELGVTLVLGLVFVGCERAVPPQKPAGSRAATSKSSPVETKSAAPEIRAPVSLGEGQQFAEAFESAIYASDPSIVTRMIDWERLLQTAIRGIDAPESLREEFVRGGLSEKQGLAVQLSRAVATGSSFRLLRVYEEDDERRALFRLLQPSSGVKYHELILGRDSTGAVRAVDIYFFLSGERLSRTMRRTFLLAAAEQPGDPLGRVLNGDNEFIKHADEFRQMSAELQAGNPQKSIEIYQELPLSMQREKTVMLLYVQATAGLDDDLYAQAIDDFRAVHNRDACVDMVSIDGHLLREEYDRALEAVARVDKAVGGDPYMDVLRANINLMRKEPSIAEVFAKQAISQDPELIDAYWALITVSLVSQSYQDTVSWLTTIQQKFDIELEDLRTISDYADFVKSPEYEAWQGKRRGAATEQDG